MRWLQLARSGGPSPREDHTWTVDAEGGVAYLFGGRGADGPLNDLWAFDLAAGAWSQVHITVDLPVPEPRFGHTATWVPDVGLVVWSGQGKSGFFDDIWSYEPNVNAWRQLPDDGDVPLARYGSCASLGPDGELWVSHGFTQDSGRFADTRSYNFETGKWTNRTVTGLVPFERCLHDCFWSAGQRLILYAGQTTGVAALDDPWSYDITTGSWSRADGPAPARQLYALAPTDSGAFVFGGGSLERDYLDDLWFIDGETVAMTQVEPTRSPPARAGATMLHDASGSRLLLFGGTNGSGLLDDLWELPLEP